MFKNLICIDLISPVEPAPSNSPTNWGDAIIFLIICVAIILTFAAIIGLITYFAIKHRDLKKQLSQKNKPIAFTNKSNHDITIIAPDNYAEIEIQFKLFDKNDIIIKKYTIKELNLIQNEQRVIANLKDFDAYKISYSIINYK